jgi:hypothetical protein
MKPVGLRNRSRKQGGSTAAQLHATITAADESNNQTQCKVGIGGDDGHDGHGDER